MGNMSSSGCGRWKETENLFGVASNTVYQCTHTLSVGSISISISLPVRVCRMERITTRNADNRYTKRWRLTQNNEISLPLPLL